MTDETPDAMHKWPKTTPSGHVYVAPTTYDELCSRHTDAAQASVECWVDAECPPEPTWEMVGLAHREVERLTAERDEARATVDRVRELAQEMRSTLGLVVPGAVGKRIDRALDGHLIQDASQTKCETPEDTASDLVAIRHHMSLAIGAPVDSVGDVIDGIAMLRRETDQAGAADLRVRKALAGHPSCDVHPDDDPITCGWKRVVADITHALEEDD